jgi:hypothetical protein
MASWCKAIMIGDHAKHFVKVGWFVEADAFMAFCAGKVMMMGDELIG